MHFTFSNGMPDATPQIIPLELPALQAAPAPAGPQSVKEILAALESIEGGSCFHGAIFYSSTADLELERYRTAKRLASACELQRMIYFELLQLWRSGQTHCAFCMCELTSLRNVEALGNRLLHHACARQFDDELVSSRYEITNAGVEAAASWEAETESRALAAGER